MSEHTKEPWFVPAEKPTSIVVEGTEIACGLREKDARRIVACVNALKGIVDPEKEIPSLQAQRDELLVIGRRLIQKVDAGFDIVTWDDEWDKLRAAITNAEDELGKYLKEV